MSQAWTLNPNGDEFWPNAINFRMVTKWKIIFILKIGLQIIQTQKLCAITVIVENLSVKRKKLSTVQTMQFIHNKKEFKIHFLNDRINF